MAVEEVPTCLLCLSVDFVMCQYVNQQRVLMEPSFTRFASKEGSSKEIMVSFLVKDKHKKAFRNLHFLVNLICFFV